MNPEEIYNATAARNMGAKNPKLTEWESQPAGELWRSIEWFSETARMVRAWRVEKPPTPLETLAEEVKKYLL